MFRQHSAVPRSGDGCEVAERVYQVNGHGRHDAAAEEEAGEGVSSMRVVLMLTMPNGFMITENV